MKWSDKQLKIYETWEKTNNSLAIEASPGCLGINTPILMYDGSIKMVQDIKIGDKVMGIDSLPRNVLSTNQGKDELFKIIPQKGESFICNSKHILTLHSKAINRSIKIYKKTKHISPLIDLPISNFLNNYALNEQGNIQGYFLQRFGVDFKEKETTIDPYLLGLWIAEGTKEKGTPSFSINSHDLELIDYLKQIKIDNLSTKTKQDSENCLRISVTQVKNKGQKNILRNEFKKCIIDKEDICIPENYLINSKENRLKLLAGLLDGDGYLHENCFEIITKYSTLSKNIVFLCRSLGLAAYGVNKTGKIKSLNFSGNYYKISISGNVNIVSNKLLRKKAKPRKQIKNVLRTGFKIEKLGVGNWYGFSVDKDNRFLLGDFTVTHNSGKTTVLLEILKRSPVFKSKVFLAFNKSIQLELERKVPPGVDTFTLHSIGYRTLLKNSSNRYKLNEIKNWVLGKQIFEKKFKDQKKESFYLFSVSNLVDLYRMNMCSNKEELIHVADKFGADYFNGEIDDALKLIDYLKTYNSSDHGKKPMLIDFIDMIYLPVILLKDSQFPKYDVVMIDECQDLNSLQFELVKKLFKKRTRFCAVGDGFQAIYSFMGADKDMFTKIKNYPNTITLPLSYSYRCPVSVVKEANKVFNFVESPEGQQEGEVTHDGDFKDISPGDFVLCRNNKPLVELFLELIKRNKKAHIMGKDFGKGLLNVINKLERIDNKSIDDLLSKKEESLKEKGVKNPKNHLSYQNLIEKLNIISMLHLHFQNEAKLKVIIEDMFKDKEDRDSITLSTIHKSKGLESDTVYILAPELIPSEYAKTELDVWSEKCLLYVAITRSKNKLIFVPLKNL